MSPAGQIRQTQDRPMRLTRQQKRRRFTDPVCRGCGPGPVAYAWRKNEHNRWRIRATCSKCNAKIKDYTRSRVPARIKIAMRPESAHWEIRYPRKPSEFEVQAFLYCELRRLGFDARGEVSTRDGDCRFDIVVFSGRRAVRIIEVKGEQKAFRSLQIRQYENYRVKVVSICGMDEARALLVRAAAATPRRPLTLNTDFGIGHGKPPSGGENGTADKPRGMIR
jgi:hypothetical protein